MDLPYTDTAKQLQTFEGVEQSTEHEFSIEDCLYHSRVGLFHNSHPWLGFNLVFNRPEAHPAFISTELEQRMTTIFENRQQPAVPSWTLWPSGEEVMTRTPGKRSLN